MLPLASEAAIGTPLHCMYYGGYFFLPIYLCSPSLVGSLRRRVGGGLGIVRQIESESRAFGSRGKIGTRSMTPNVTFVLL